MIHQKQVLFNILSTLTPSCGIIALPVGAGWLLHRCVLLGQGQQCVLISPSYKLSLGKLVELPHPIPSRSLRRITFVLTDGKRLNEAWEINDLFPGSREQDLLWRALKEARLQAEQIDASPQKCVAAILEAAAGLGGPREAQPARKKPLASD